MLPNIFKDKEYARPRLKPLLAYVEQQTTHLSRMFPDRPIEEIQTFVKNTVLKSMEQPTAHVLYHPEPGNTNEQYVSLVQHTNVIKNDIITPSGSVYMLPTEKESPIKRTMTKNGQLRKKHKNLMLQAYAIGDELVASQENYKQASVKIQNNSIPGAMKSPYNPLYDLAGYNSITSPARHSVMNGYAHVEKLVAGNLFLTGIEDVINYIVCHHRVCPPDILETARVYGLYIPSDIDVCNYFMSSLKYYTSLHMKKQVRAQVMETLSHYPRATKLFVFYANCLKNLVEHNDQLMRSFITDLFRTDIPTNPSLDPEKLEKDVEKDLLMMLASVNHEILQGKAVEKAVKEAPEGARQLYTLCRHAETCLVRMRSLLRTFFTIHVDVPKAMYHPKMIRKVVNLSDTDSVVFTTQSMVRWYCGKVKFDRASYEICAFTVWMVSQTLEHLFARLSVGFGMVGEDIYKISMKNEFLFPIVLRTHASKHYAAIQLIKEGKRLPVPLKEIKGVQFRGSALSAETNTDAEEFLMWILNTSMSEEGLKSTDVLGRVVKHEKKIYDSLMSGEMTFLKGATVKQKEEYADPEKSNYFYYLMWEEVFAGRFGNFVIPNKGFDMPVADDGRAFYNEEWQNRLRKFDHRTSQRLDGFLARMRENKRKVSRIVIPPSLDVIPEILRPIIDVRSIIAANGAPHYLALQALNLCSVNTKEKQIASDYFDVDGFSLYA